MSRPAFWTFQELLRQDLGRTVAWVTKSVAHHATELPWRLATPMVPLPYGTETLVVVGGGTLIDEAKAFRAREAGATRLVAIPSRWGSGADASPVTVLDRGGRKEIHVDSAWLPDAAVIWPELALELPEPIAREGCADALSHAVEGFLSPLAAEALRAEVAEVLERMLRTQGRDAAWFELSRTACAAQARSSVGLVHGIAHTLEAPLRAAGLRFGHARLCATFLWPVLRFDLTSSSRAHDTLQRGGIDAQAMENAARELFSASDYAQCRGALAKHWPEILRDPCTRTNCVLVRPAALEFFMDRFSPGDLPS